MNISSFNQWFPSSTYRIVGATSKAPINNLVYDFDEAMKVISESNQSLRLGWIIDTDHIVVDIDCDPAIDASRDKAKRVFELIRKENIKSVVYSTPRGLHCIFKRGMYDTKNTVKGFMALGIFADIRVYGSYVILPHNDAQRKWWGGSSKQLDVMPSCFKVISKSRNLVELWGLKEGDGRNDALYTLLQKSKIARLVKLEIDEIKRNVELSNKYILETPMSDRELYSTILRPENLNIATRTQGTSVFSEYASRIMRENDIIYTNDVFFMVKDDSNIYQMVSDIEMDRFIYMNYTKELSSRNRDEVLKALKHETYTPWEECNRDIYDVPFKNGVFNVKTGGFRQTLPSDYITYCLPHNYDPSSRSSEWVDLFYSISLEGNMIKRDFFNAMLGYCMTRSSEFQTFYVFKGRGGTGKSAMINIITAVLGQENIANLQLNDFNKEFGIEALFNKLANLGDDISTTKLTDSELFKKASSGDVLNVNRKFKSALVFKPFAKIIFTSNNYPKILDKSRAMERRMRILASDRVILPTEIIPDFEKKWQPHDFATLINNALLAFHKLLVSGQRTFPDPHESLEMKEKLRLLGDRVYYYIKSTYPDDDPKEALHNRGVMAKYQEFVSFCKDRNYTIASADTFREQACDILEYTTNLKDGIEVFLKGGSDEE